MNKTVISNNIYIKSLLNETV